MTDIERLPYDVVVIGACGSGLRAAIEARQAGKKTAIISKSLFGKAHTVMAEGGCAASMGNVNPNDNWQVHFRDTMRGGKFLNNWRMAELHAKEAPDRVWELEAWGALFDRTKDGKISQRNFGGHEYPRLAHVGDRTGLEIIRTLQQRVVALQQQDAIEHGDPEAMIKVFSETTVTRLMLDAGKIAGAFGYVRGTGQFLLFEAPAVVLATGGIGKSYKVTSNSWEYTGDGHALALLAGASLLNMEFVQLHPTGMIWPPSVKGILVTESVRGDGGVLRNSEGKRFMFNYVPDVFRAQYAETEEEADRWYTDPDHNRRPPELLPRDEVARSINSEVKEGRGTEHGGVFLDIASRRPADYILQRLPSMYHQFKELADVDITKEPMEIGPTAHYVMGGVEVDPDTQAASVPGLYAAGEVSGGMHGSNRLGGNSLSDLLVFGRRAGAGRRGARGLGQRGAAGGQPGGAGRGGVRGAGAAGAGGRREPLRGARGPAAADDRPGRADQERGRAAERPGRAGEAPGPGGPRERGGRPGLQPGLAPGPGPAQHAAGLGLRGPVGAGAAGVAGRPHPRGLPGDVAGLAQGQPGVHAPGRRGGPGDPGPPARHPDARGPAQAVRAVGTEEVPDRG